eukprot:6182720-Pleurochrysis_carterae.AAC.4
MSAGSARECVEESACIARAADASLLLTGTLPSRDKNVKSATKGRMSDSKKSMGAFKIMSASTPIRVHRQWHVSGQMSGKEMGLRAPLQQSSQYVGCGSG